MSLLGKFKGKASRMWQDVKATSGRPSDLEYRPLNEQNSEIRVLILNPGKWKEDICCDLEIVSLDEGPEYETISYVWGDCKVRKSIYVNGSRLQVTVNLFAALRRFRHRHTPRVLWADAVCINQGDKDERSSQVQLMGRIYKECFEVRIWLGEEDDFPYNPPTDMGDPSFSPTRGGKSTLPESHNLESSLDIPAAIHLLHLLAAGKHLYELPFFQIQTFPKFVFSRRWHNVYNSLVHFLSRPWFNRLWTIQEAVLPPKAIIQLGEAEIDFEILITAEQSLAEHSTHSGCCTPICGSLWEFGWSADSLLSVAFSRTSMFDVSRARFFHQTGRPATFAKDFIAPLRIARERGVTDPRDCVYGLLGLFPQILPTTAIPDYDLDVSTLYCRCTRRLFECNMTLERFRDIDHHSSNPYNLPSWCLNWNQKRTLFMDEHYNACGQSHQYHRISSYSSDKTLAVEAIFIGETVHILDSFNTDKEDIGTMKGILTQWQNLAIEEAGIRNEAFWRVVFLDRPIVNVKMKQASEDAYRMHGDDFLAVESWWHWLATCDPVKRVYPFTPCSEESFENCFGGFNVLHWDERKTAFYSTNTKMIGVTNSEIRRNDRICVCKGSPVPIILCPCEGGLYSFVGVSYVHGIMEGAATEGAVWETVLLC